jgi:deaminated glutathione amidase
VAGRVRVAAVQLSSGIDQEENLATCRRMIDRAAGEGAQVIVLPEFCNHPSWYDDEAHAWAVACDLDGPWLSGIAERAATHRAWVMVNVTRRAEPGVLTASNVLYDPSGAAASVSDKQVLMGAENRHLARGRGNAPVVETPYGRLATYSCMDGVIFETPRGLALRGAQVLLNSLNSFALDEADLHIPVRAAENRVFVVAANKVGPLIPAHALSHVSERMGVPPERLHGAGESQVVAPDGSVLAQAPPTGEAVAVADIDPARSDDKRRPDGTDVFAARRPELYTAITGAPRGRRRPAGSARVDTAVVQVADDTDAAVTAVLDAVAGGARLVVTPELAGVPGGLVTDPAAAASAGELLLRRIAGGLADAGTQDRAVVVTSVVEGLPGGFAHTGVVVGAGGVVGRQRQLHAVARHAWVSTLGTELAPVDLWFGRLAVVVGDDSVYPETTRLAALDDADVVAVPGAVQEVWEVSTGLVERAAENRVCLLAATRAGAAGTSLVATLERDFTLWTSWSDRTFDGRISFPRLTVAREEDPVATAVIHPERAANRILTQDTDIVDSRPWQLCGELVGSQAAPVAGRAGSAV